MTESGPSTPATPKTEQDALRAATFQRLHPKVYLERFLAENVRPDGRGFDEWREVSVNVGWCSFSARLGNSLQAHILTLIRARRVNIDCRRFRSGAVREDDSRVWGEGRDRRTRAGQPRGWFPG